MCLAALLSPPFRPAHHLFNEIPQPRKRSFAPLRVSCLSRQASKEQVFSSVPQPPWLVDPPVPLKNPFSDELPVFDFQMTGDESGIPFSLKIVRLRKKMMNSQRGVGSGCDRGSVGNAVWSLASVMEEFQRVSQMVDTKNGALLDTSDSIVWLFQKVFYSSPQFVVGLLGLMDEFLTNSAVPVLDKALVDDLESSPSFVPSCWSDIGVLGDNKETGLCPEFLDHQRRRAAYEHSIISGTTNSLVLSNYAQLLYQYYNDLERARDYFKLSVMAEPSDAEVMNRYALFLWHGLGDLQASEEMFLEAILADSENHYYRSSYACFLWQSGGTETCFPLPMADGEKDEDNIFL